MTVEKFKKRANIVHNNKYTYLTINSKVLTTDKIAISCPIHGEFTQRVSDHLQGNGCKVCGQEVAKGKNTKTQEQFIERANKVHKNFYNYSKTLYTGAHAKVTITCPVHGDFSQEASSHINKRYGCPKCGNKKTKSKNTVSQIEFLERAKQQHADLYDYTKATYKDMHTKVTITCKIHGDFQQAPNHHLRGRGCPACNKHFNAYRKSYYKGKPAILYVLYIPDKDVYKVGITSRQVTDRYKQENCSYQIKFEQHFLDGGDAWSLEKYILKELKQYKYKGDKVFKHTSNSEVLTTNPTNKIIQRIIDEQRKNTTTH
jgi:Zn finger protein HypA/HybF involved in hydrogenase expression